MKRFLTLLFFILIAFSAAGAQTHFIEPKLEGFLSPSGTFVSFDPTMFDSNTSIARYLPIYATAPTCVRKGQLYYDSVLNKGGVCVATGSPGTWETQLSGVAGTAWGAITGTLSSQTDLQTALNLKANLASPIFSGQPTIGVGGTSSALTDLLINPTTKTSGNLIDLQVNASSKFSVNSAGSMTLAGTATVGSINLPGAGSTIIGPGDGYFRLSGRLNLTAPVNGDALFQNATVNGLQALSLGGAVPAVIGTTPTHAQTFSILQAEELLTIAAAATSVTTMQIPANAVVMSVSVRVTTVIPTAATFTVKVGSTTCSTTAIAVAATTTDPGTAAGSFYNSAAQGVTITPNLTPGAATGVVRVTVTYYVITPPTS